MYVSASPIITGADLWGRPKVDNLAAVYPQARPTTGGRAALAAALTELGLGRGDGVLMPAYICPTVVRAVAHNGYKPIYYDIDPDLAPEADQFRRGLARAAAVVTVHYWGFPQPMDRLIPLADRAGVPVVEDCALALFSSSQGRLLGDFGQAALFSLPKTLPVPDGGLLWLKRAGQPNRPPVGRNLVGLAKLLVYKIEELIGLSARTYLLADPKIRARAYASDSEAPSRAGRISATSWAIAQNNSAARIIQLRRRNYQRWAERTRDMDKLSPVFPDLPEGVCPLGFPVLAAPTARDRIRDGLHRRGVAVRSFWDRLAPEIERGGYPNALELSRRILTLPVHQTLSQRSLDRTARLLKVLAG